MTVLATPSSADSAAVPRSAADFIALEDEWGAHNYHPLDIVIDRASGSWVYDVDGNRYLDCLSAYSAVNQGHCHPRILATMIEQAHRVTLTSRDSVRNAAILERLNEEIGHLPGVADATLMRMTP